MGLGLGWVWVVLVGFWLCEETGRRRIPTHAFEFFITMCAVAAISRHTKAEDSIE